MQKLIDETERRRQKQIAYNLENGITPRSVNKTPQEIMNQPSVAPRTYDSMYAEQQIEALVADPVLAYMSRPQLERAVADARSRMEEAARDLDFMNAARFRDEMLTLEKLLAQRES